MRLPDFNINDSLTKLLRLHWLPKMLTISESQSSRLKEYSTLGDKLMLR
ncbi:hypothetical protein XIS1_1680022 [Xenorhabdus innexi]|uniref:Uncharacterized protein n=1 Tax=Xenorhabdus innexi TaxID=290109 RepID=A0A1N6MV90_9GAMM|nr:hypothetical protein XIS1_1680022 [Xenorhabdus innexi]